MIFLYSFLIGGLICAIAQFLMDKFKLIPIYVTCLFVTLGSIFTAGELYQKLVDFSGIRKAYEKLLPISNFGASLTLSALEEAKEVGYIGILTGMFNKTAPGIIVVMVLSFILALIFKPRG